MRTALSIGDLVRAVRTLRADEKTAADIAGLLGLSVPLAATATRQVPVAPAAPIARAAEVQPFVPSTASRPSGLQASLEPVARDLPARSTEVAALPSESVFQRPPREIPPLDTLLPAPAAPEIDGETSLFVRTWQRGVLTALVGVLTPTGGLDVERIVDLISRRSAVQQLPRRAAYTTRMGLQLLVDTGHGMWPFGADAVEIENALQLTVAREAVSVLRFDQSPRRGVGAGPRRTWKAYLPPPEGTPILVLSDFGLADPAADLPSASAEWEAVAGAALVAHCPLLALTPFPASRWPSWLTAMFAVVPWEKSTTAALARRAAERALRKYR